MKKTLFYLNILTIITFITGCNPVSIDPKIKDVASIKVIYQEDNDNITDSNKTSNTNNVNGTTTGTDGSTVTNQTGTVYADGTIKGGSTTTTTTDGTTNTSGDTTTSPTTTTTTTTTQPLTYIEATQKSLNENQREISVQGQITYEAEPLNTEKYSIEKGDIKSVEFIVTNSVNNEVFSKKFTNTEIVKFYEITYGDYKKYRGKYLLNKKFTMPKITDEDHILHILTKVTIENKKFLGKDYTETFSSDIEINGESGIDNNSVVTAEFKNVETNVEVNVNNDPKKVRFQEEGDFQVAIKDSDIQSILIKKIEVFAIDENSETDNAFLYENYSREVNKKLNIEDGKFTYHYFINKISDRLHTESYKLLFQTKITYQIGSKEYTKETPLLEKTFEKIEQTEGTINSSIENRTTEVSVNVNDDPTLAKLYENGELTLTFVNSTNTNHKIYVKKIEILAIDENSLSDTPFVFYSKNINEEMKENLNTGNYEYNYIVNYIHKRLHQSEYKMQFKTQIIFTIDDDKTYMTKTGYIEKIFEAPTTVDSDITATISDRTTNVEVNVNNDPTKVRVQETGTLEVSTQNTNIKSMIMKKIEILAIDENAENDDFFTLYSKDLNEPITKNNNKFQYQYFINKIGDRLHPETYKLRLKTKFTYTVNGALYTKTSNMTEATFEKVNEVEPGTITGTIKDRTTNVEVNVNNDPTKVKLQETGKLEVTDSDNALKEITIKKIEILAIDENGENDDFFTLYSKDLDQPIEKIDDKFEYQYFINKISDRLHPEAYNLQLKTKITYSVNNKLYIVYSDLTEKTVEKPTEIEPGTITGNITDRTTNVEVNVNNDPTKVRVQETGTLEVTTTDQSLSNITINKIEVLAIDENGENDNEFILHSKDLDETVWGENGEFKYQYFINKISDRLHTESYKLRLKTRITYTVQGRTYTKITNFNQKTFDAVDSDITTNIEIETTLKDTNKEKMKINQYSIIDVSGDNTKINEVILKDIKTEITNDFNGSKIEFDTPVNKDITIINNKAHDSYFQQKEIDRVTNEEYQLYIKTTVYLTVNGKEVVRQTEETANINNINTTYNITDLTEINYNHLVEETLDNLKINVDFIINSEDLNKEFTVKSITTKISNNLNNDVKEINHITTPETYNLIDGKYEFTADFSDSVEKVSLTEDYDLYIKTNIELLIDGKTKNILIKTDKHISQGEESFDANAEITAIKDKDDVIKFYESNFTISNLSNSENNTHNVILESIEIDYIYAVNGSPTIYKTKKTKVLNKKLIRNDSNQEYMDTYILDLPEDDFEGASYQSGDEIFVKTVYSYKIDNYQYKTESQWVDYLKIP